VDSRSAAEIVADDSDLIHSHVGHRALPFPRLVAIPTVQTLRIATRLLCSGAGWRTLRGVPGPDRTEKGPALAVAPAKATGVRLKIAVKVDPADRAYFESEIQPLLPDLPDRLRGRDYRGRQAAIPG
jgi:hypothetical protein